MEDYAVRIKKRRDGLVVARIPSLSRAVGYGLDRDEAIYELFKRILLRRGEHRARGAPRRIVAIG